jgi:integrase
MSASTLNSDRQAGHARRAVSAGVNVLALQRMLGHTSAAMTLDTYSDLFDDDRDAVAVTLHSRYSR